jgi:hypothetical protein
MKGPPGDWLVVHSRAETLRNAAEQKAMKVIIGNG